jgi:hypothetical protein
LKFGYPPSEFIRPNPKPSTATLQFTMVGGSAKQCAVSVAARMIRMFRAEIACRGWMHHCHHVPGGTTAADMVQVAPHASQLQCLEEQ